MSTPNQPSGSNPYGQQPGQYPQQPGQHPGQQPGQYPQQPGQYPQQPGQYPQQPGQQQYPGQQYGQPYPQGPYQQQAQPYAQYQQYGQAYGYPAPAGQLAGWGQRFVAYLVDSLIVAIPMVLAFVITLVFGETTATGSSVTGVAAIPVFLLYLAAFVLAIWNMGIREGQTGQSIGKGVIGLQVRKEADGHVPGAGLGVGRYFAKILNSIVCGLPIGWLWPLWDSKSQTWADKIVATQVFVTPKQ